MKRLWISTSLLFAGLILLSGCKKDAETAAHNAAPALVSSADADTAFIVTFVELGSTRCIPCQQMMPVMEAVEEEYGDQVKVVFHDVWTDEGKPYAEKYGIKLIPTQVFLDQSGKEVFRHEGFFPKDELVAELKKHGVQ